MYKKVIEEVNKLLSKVSEKEMKRNHKLKRKTKKVLILAKHLEILTNQQGGKNG